jgi:hypothetical protein
MKTRNFTLVTAAIVIMASFFACRKDKQDTPVVFKPYNPTVNFRLKSTTAQNKGVDVGKVNYKYNNEQIDSIISDNGYNQSKYKVNYSSDEISVANVYGYNESLSLDDAGHIINYAGAYGIWYTLFTYEGDQIKTVGEYIGSRLFHKVSISYTDNRPVFMEGYEYVNTDSLYEKRELFYENGLICDMATSFNIQGTLFRGFVWNYYYSNGLLDMVVSKTGDEITEKELFEYNSIGLLSNYKVVNYYNNASGDTTTNIHYEYEAGKGNMRQLINPYNKLRGYPYPI